MKIDYKVYECGVDAAYAGKTSDDNPHEPGTTSYYAWYEGWSDADEAIFRNGFKMVE